MQTPFCDNEIKSKYYFINSYVDTVVLTPAGH